MLTVTVSQPLDEFQDMLAKAAPKKCLKAVRIAVNETLERTKKKGVAIAVEDYALVKGAKEKISTSTRIRKASDDGFEGLVEFPGKPGVPLRYFKANPRRALPDFKGVTPRKRKPKGGVRIMVKKRGAMKAGRGPLGQSLFWFKGANGSILLGYRGEKLVRRTIKRAGRKDKEAMVPQISTKGLFGPSPIQGLSRKDKREKIEEYANDTLRKRVEHQLNRIIGKGE